MIYRHKKRRKKRPPLYIRLYTFHLDLLQGQRISHNYARESLLSTDPGTSCSGPDEERSNAPRVMIVITTERKEGQPRQREDCCSHFSGVKNGERQGKSDHEYTESEVLRRREGPRSREADKAIAKSKISWLEQPSKLNNHTTNCVF
jgi:hypothetical protein